MSNHQYGPCTYNTCTCQTGLQNFIYANQWFCKCGHPLQQHQQLNTINLSPSTNISVFNNSPSSYNHQIFPTPNQMMQSPFSINTLNLSNMLFTPPNNILTQTPNLQHQLMFGQHNLTHPNFTNPFANNNITFNSPYNNNNVFNIQNLQTPMTSNIQTNNHVTTQSVRSPGYENNQRHRNRNSRTSHRTTNSSYTSENSSEYNSINELEITCMLYPTFNNHQKYYLSNPTTEKELKEKDWIWQFHYSSDDNEPSVSNKVREQIQCRINEDITSDTSEYDIFFYRGNSCKTNNVNKLSRFNTFHNLKSLFRQPHRPKYLHLVIVGGNNLTLTPKNLPQQPSTTHESDRSTSIPNNIHIPSNRRNSNFNNDENSNVNLDNSAIASSSLTIVDYNSVASQSVQDNVSNTITSNTANNEITHQPISNNEGIAEEQASHSTPHQVIDNTQEQEINTNNQSMDNNYNVSESNTSPVLNSNKRNLSTESHASNTTEYEYVPIRTRQRVCNEESNVSTRSRRNVNPPDYYRPPPFSQSSIRTNVQLSLLNSTSTNATIAAVNNANDTNVENNETPTNTIVLSSDSENEDMPHSPILLNSVPKSNIVEEGDFWYHNPDDLFTSEASLSSRANLFRYNIVNKEHNIIDTTIIESEKRVEYHWQERKARITKKQFESTDYIYRMFEQIMKEHKNNPRKLCKSTTILFNDRTDVGADAGGLTTEAIERFSTSFLSIYSKLHPHLFEMLDDTYITITTIPSSIKDKNVIRFFLFATKFIILHTGHFPALCDPTLLISIFNYSFKLEDVFYAHYKLPYAHMEKEEMRSFYKSCKDNGTSGIFRHHELDDSPLGCILQYIEIASVSKNKVDKALTKGEFIMFMKKEYFKKSVGIGKWIADNLLKDTLAICDIPHHEFCQMLNHTDDIVALYWSHYQPVNSMEEFIECVQLPTKEMILDTIKFLKQQMFVETLTDIEDKNAIRNVVVDDDKDATLEEIELLFQCYLVIYLYSAPPKYISILYESITSKKFLLGYRGIQFSFSHDTSIYREYFMRVSSCYLEAEFYIIPELLDSLLKDYNTFVIDMDAMLDSMKYSAL